jgi:hypothetical protein
MFGLDDCYFSSFTSRERRRTGFCRGWRSPELKFSTKKKLVQNQNFSKKFSKKLYIVCISSRQKLIFLFSLIYEKKESIAIWEDKKSIKNCLQEFVTTEPKILAKIYLVINYLQF